MSYLESLSEQKISREKYEQGILKMKTLIVQIEVLHNNYNGGFLNDLEDFLKYYKPKSKLKTV